MFDPTPSSAFVTVDYGEACVRAVIDPAHLARACRGHFPGDPLVPGAALVALMAAAAQLLTSPHARIAAVEHATFRRRIHPGDDVVVVASARAGGIVDTVVQAGGSDVAHARLCLT